MLGKNNNPFSLDRKTILVTGASSGIGRSIAIECSRSGANLIITGRNEERLNETFHSLEGSNHRQIMADLQQTKDILNLAKELSDLDGLVHAAGIVKTLPFSFISRDDFASILETNLVAPAMLSQLLVKNKKLNKDASIVLSICVQKGWAWMFGKGKMGTLDGEENLFLKEWYLRAAVA